MRAKAFSGLSQRRQGQLFALAAIFSGVNSSVFLKFSVSIPPAEVVSIRSAMALLILCGLIVSSPSPSRKLWWDRNTMLRAGCDAIATLTVALAVFELPISLLMAFLTSLPIFSILLSSVILKERLQAKAWGAVMLALVGCLMILKPALELSQLGVLLTLTASVAYALRDVFTRQIPCDFDTYRLVLLSLALVFMVTLALPSDIPWSNPTLLDLTLTAFAAVTFLGANLLIVSALRRATVPDIAPLRYTSVLWALVYDAFFWGYFPDTIACVGVTLIFTAFFILLKVSPKRKILPNGKV